MSEQSHPAEHTLATESVVWNRAVQRLATAVMTVGDRNALLLTADAVVDSWPGDVDLRRRNGYWRVTFYEPSMEYAAFHELLWLAVLEAARRTFT